MEAQQEAEARAAAQVAEEARLAQVKVQAAQHASHLTAAQRVTWTLINLDAPREPVFCWLNQVTTFVLVMSDGVGEELTWENLSVAVPNEHIQAVAVTPVDSTVCLLLLSLFFCLLLFVDFVRFVDFSFFFLSSFLSFRIRAVYS